MDTVHATLLWIGDTTTGWGGCLCSCGKPVHIDTHCYAGLNGMGTCDTCGQRTTVKANEARFFVCMTIYPHQYGYGPNDVPANKPRGCFKQITYEQAKYFLAIRGLDIDSTVDEDYFGSSEACRFFLTPLLLITGMETAERAIKDDTFDWEGYFEDESPESQRGERLKPLISRLPHPVINLADASGGVAYSMEAYTAYSAFCPVCGTEHVGYFSSD